ncbi:MAG: NlpC/P60 family protein, partial [Spirochaetia bacterium]|nr:NlpC/P60 family protein [Spirochaetia bacterium]
MMLKRMLITFLTVMLPLSAGAELINKYTIAELTPTVVPQKIPKQAKTTKRAIILETARSLIGVDYWPGGQDMDYGFDCSALTQYAYSKAGIRIPRRAVD